MNLPTKVTFTRCDTEESVTAQIIQLNREVAKQEIDGTWWRDLESSKSALLDEPDHHWRWRELVSSYQNKPAWSARCIQTPDNRIQAAMLFRVDARSAIEQSERAVFVDRLATAPRNRSWLVDKPVFRGNGKGLLLY